jgi:hypothetical protein
MNIFSLNCKDIIPELIINVKEANLKKENLKGTVSQDFETSDSIIIQPLLGP